MTTITLDKLHLAENPEREIELAAARAHMQAGSDTRALIVRCPDRSTDGVRALSADDIARMLQRHGRVREIAVTDGGTIVAAADVIDRRGEIAIWTGQAIGPWHPSDIAERGLGGSETAAVRLAEELARMGFVVTLYGQFEQDGLVGDIMLRDYRTFDPSERLEVLVGFRNATLFDERPNAGFCALWLEDLAPAEGLTRTNAANIDVVCSVSVWHRGQILRVHPWLEQEQVVACRNGITVDWFRDED